MDRCLHMKSVHQCLSIENYQINISLQQSALLFRLFRTLRIFRFPILPSNQLTDVKYILPFDVDFND